MSGCFGFLVVGLVVGVVCCWFVATVAAATATKKQARTNKNSTN